MFMGSIQPSFFQQNLSIDLDNIKLLIICLEKQKTRLNGSGVVQTIDQILPAGSLAKVLHSAAERILCGSRGDCRLHALL